MTDSAATDSPNLSTPTAERSPGAMLRQAREARGMHIATLAANIKVSPARLEALEADDYSGMPDTTFARALAQTVCRALHIEPAPVLALMPESFHTRLERVDEGINAPFRDRPGGGLPDVVEGGMGWRLIVAFVALLLIGAALFLFWPKLSGEGDVPLFPPGAEGGSDGVATQVIPSGAQADEAALAAATGATDAANASGGAPGADATANVADGASAGTVTTPVATPTVTPSSVAVSAADAAGTAATAVTDGAAGMATAAATATAAAASAAGGLVAAITGGGEAGGPSAVAANETGPVLRAIQDTWVQVNDARGRVLLSRTIVAGETVPLTGAEPMRFRIGNVKGTELRYNGQTVDLQPYDTANTARLTLPLRN